MAHAHLRIMVAILVLGISVTTFAPQRISASPVQAVYPGLNWPVAFTFLPDGRILFNEKNTGNIRVIASNGNLISQPFATVGPLPPWVDGTEQGLLGIALDPQFNVNNYVYVYWTYYNSADYKHSIISRFTATANNIGVGRTDIFEFTDPNPNQPPSGPTNHNGGYIKFGPDGKLYVELGDFCSWDCLGHPLAQDLTTYAGKILRINPDGSVPNDNPFGSLVYAYGYRNGVGMDFSPAGKLIATMAGPDCCDRILSVNAGDNFGWPNCGTVSQPACSSPYQPSIYQWGSPTVTPTGIAYSENPNILYFGEYNTGNLMRLILTSTGSVAQLDIIATVGAGILAIERGPNGFLYFSTSDTIYRLNSGPTISVSNISVNVVNAPLESVVYVLPDWQSTHTKPSGVGPAALSDFTALGFMYGSSTNTQVMALDTNSAYFDQSNGAPKISNGVLVLFAGPVVNEVVEYYESSGTSPLYFKRVTQFGITYFAWYDRANTQKGSITESANMAGSSDIFTIQYFTDANNNMVFVIYGMNYKGTYASGVFFKTYLLPNLSSFTHGWYIYQWNDSNSNGLPDPSEVNTTPVNYGEGLRKPKRNSWFSGKGFLQGDTEHFHETYVV